MMIAVTRYGIYITGYEQSLNAVIAEEARGVISQLVDL